MRGDGDKHFLVVGGSPCRQRQQAWPLDREPLGFAPIASTNHLGHKPAIIAEMGFLRCPWALSIVPFSWATPGLFRVGVMP
jgi:hypothetical protein